MTKQFTGYHMTGILVAFFGVVVAVNIAMAHFASSTFGGIVVENSYVASQEFNKWFAEARESEHLGWNARTDWHEDGRLLVTIDGPGSSAILTGVAWHPLGQLPDRDITFDRQADGSFLSRQSLPAGRWTLRLQVSDGANLWRKEENLQ